MALRNEEKQIKAKNINFFHSHVKLYNGFLKKTFTDNCFKFVDINS